MIGGRHAAGATSTKVSECSTAGRAATRVTSVAHGAHRLDAGGAVVPVVPAVAMTEVLTPQSRRRVIASGSAAAVAEPQAAAPRSGHASICQPDRWQRHPQQAVAAGAAAVSAKSHPCLCRWAYRRVQISPCTTPSGPMHHLRFLPRLTALIAKGTPLPPTVP